MDRMKKESSVSNFIHVDSGNPLPEKNGDVLHMHATGVPLWIFFDSINMDLSKDCLVLDNGKKFCNDDKNTLKFYVNGQPNNEFGSRVIKDLDKYLVSYGNEDEAAIQQQLSSVTNLAAGYSSSG